MFKELLTLLRGKANAAAAGIAQNNALVILDQQIRDAGASIQTARRAWAVATAEHRQEDHRMKVLTDRIASLEDRTRTALAGNREDLALLAAGAVAELERDRDAGKQATTLLGAEIARLRQIVGEAERRFAELQRGRRLAQVSEAVGRSRLGRIEPTALTDAEQTLTALRARQLTLTMAEEALTELTATPARIADHLGAAGFGPVTQPTAATVLARLRPLAITQS